MKKRLIAIIIGIALALAIVWGVRVSRTRQPLSSVKIGGRLSSPLPASLSSPSGNLLSTAKEQEAKGDLLETQKIYKRLMSEFPNSSDMAAWQKKIEEINLRLLFSPVITPRSVQYEVKPGDTLTKISKEFKTTTELIIRSNNLKDDLLMPGRRLKVWTTPFSIIVDKSQNTMVLKTDEEMLKTYDVATGANNSTPVGTFKIVNKLPHPTWFKAGTVVPAGSPENILGSRWLGFDLAGYGIHGTTDPQSLGRQVTQGCVRMSNSDVEELYSIIPVGTEVTIVD